MRISKYFNRLRPLFCRECGSRNVSATSSQQYRQVRGKRRQVADIVCDNCGHQWWSIHPQARALARQEDAKRKIQGTLSGKTTRTEPVPGFTAGALESRRGEGEDFGITRLPDVI